MSVARRSATTGAMSRPSRTAASAAESPPSRSWSASSTSGRVSAPSRRVSRNAARSWRSRRAANSSASADSWSSHGRSSTTTSNGAASAAAASSASVAAATPKRSPAGSGSVQPTAACNTSRCRSVSEDRWGRRAETTVTRPAWASTVSDWTPCTQTTVQPSVAGCPRGRLGHGGLADTRLTLDHQDGQATLPGRGPQAANPVQDVGPTDQARLHSPNSRARALVGLVYGVSSWSTGA